MRLALLATVLLLVGAPARGQTYTGPIIDVHMHEDSLNEGIFFSIVRSSADIRSISFAGLGLVADNLTFAPPVPEPGTYGMMLAGLSLMMTMVRVHRRNDR